MKLKTTISYEEAKEIKAGGIKLKGLEDLIKNYEQTREILQKSSNTLYDKTKDLVVDDFTPAAVDKVKSLQEDYEELFAQEEKIKQYFHEEDGTTALSLLYEDLIGASSRVNYIAKDPSVLGLSLYAGYVRMIKETSEQFKKKVEADFA